MLHAYFKILYIAVLFGLIISHQNACVQKGPYEEKNEDNKLKTKTLSYLGEKKVDEPNEIEKVNQTKPLLRNQQIQINNTIDKIIQNSDGDEKLQRLKSTSWLINNMESPEEVKQRLRGLTQSYIYNPDESKKKRIIKEIYKYSEKEKNDDVRNVFLKILKCRNLSNTEPTEYHLPLERRSHACCLFA